MPIKEIFQNIPFTPVFKAMLYGQFAEKDKKEIELKDIDCKEFIDLLNLIYPTDKKITDANFEYLLKLADRFQIKAGKSLLAIVIYSGGRLYALLGRLIPQIGRNQDIEDFAKDFYRKDAYLNEQFVKWLQIVNWTACGWTGRPLFEILPYSPYYV